MINNIQVKNFKSLENINLDLKNLNLLTGLNSSGNSSLIQSILLIKQNIKDLPSKESIYNILEDEFKSEENEEIKKKLSNMANNFALRTISKLKINGEYLDLGSSERILYDEAKNQNISIKISNNLNELEFNCKIDNNIDSNYLPCSVSIKKNTESEVQFNFFDDKSFQYLNAERIAAKSFYNYSLDFIKKNNIGNHGEYFAHYLAEKKDDLLNIKSLKEENTSSYSIFENTSAWLSKISKGIDIKTEINPDLKQVKLTYSYFNKTKEIFPQNVGFGITYILPVILAILKSKPGDLLILENPESHLHPAGQAEIGKLCAKAAEAGVQLIIETHSDHFLNGIRVATKQSFISAKNIEIYYFDKDELATKIYNPKINDNGEIDEWPKGFFDEWENQLEQLLW